MWKQFKKSLNLPESYISMGLGLLVVIVAGLLIFNFIKSNREKGGVSVSKQMETTTENVTGNLAPQPLVSLPATHKVELGESLWTIAEKYYHSGYNWVTIARANQLSNPNRIYVGQEFKLPEAETIVPAGKSAALPTEPKIESDKYTVMKGNNLWQIAVRAYGDGYAWVKIANANKLINPGLIHSGNVLLIPR